MGVDSTLIEANVAMKSIVRKESGEDWRAYLQRLAGAEGLELKTREELARFDKQRKKDGKKDGTRGGRKAAGRVVRRRRRGR